MLVDDVDEDNDEKAPPGGSKMKAQGPGLKMMEFQLKTPMVQREIYTSGPYVEGSVGVYEEMGSLGFYFCLLSR